MDISESSENIAIADLVFEDLFTIKNWRNEKMDVLRQKKTLTDNDQVAYWKTVSSSDHTKLFSIKQNGVLIGYFGLVHIDYENKHAEISFLMDPKFPENTDRYAELFSKAISYACRTGFESLGLHKIFTETYAFREGHIEIISENRFTQDGVLRDHIYLNEKYYDSIIQSKLKREYEKDELE